jgi:uncharacterized protein
MKSTGFAPWLLVLVVAGALVCPALARASPAGAAPWSASASTTVVREERVFSSAGVELSGTLYLPKDGRALGAVVVTHSASSATRDLPLYTHLKTMLPSLGYAVFVYDRRGSGKSGGDLAASDYALLADDAIAAVRMLKADPRIDPKRVGIWGQSQGGWIALLAASRSAEVAFVVSVSAPVVTPDVQMIFYSINSLRVNGYPQAEIDQMVATRKAVDAYMRGTGDRETAQRLVDAARGRPWFKLTYMGDTVKDRELSRWRKEIEHDPMRTLEQVGVPTLMIFGAADPVVPVEISVERLKGMAAAHPEMRVVVIGGADHAMMTSLDPKTQMDPARVTQDDPESPEYFGVLAAWLIERVRRQALPACPS